MASVTANACLALQAPLPSSVEEVNSYTRGDGVVDWQTCFRHDAQAIEVSDTHFGLIFNPQAYQAVAYVL